MKTFFFLLVILLSFNACQKDLTAEQTGKANQGADFSTEIVKNWYNNTFKNSAEFAEYNAIQKGRKEPDWEKGTYRKTGNLEMIEFPLIKQKRNILMPMDSTITDAQRKQIMSSSLIRISFLKNEKNEIFVREMDYIPEYAYLKSKKFNIGDVQLGDANNSFTGRIITKKWNGEMISVRRFKEGKLTGTSALKKSTKKTV